MMEMVKLLQKENGIAELLLQPTYAQEGQEAPTISQAEIFADIINLARIDAKRIAEVHDVDISIKRMTPQQAAVLIQDLVKGESIQLVDVFNAIEEQREAVLEAALDEDEYRIHIKTKEKMLYSTRDEEPDPLDPEAREMLEKQKEAKTEGDGEAALSEMADDVAEQAAAEATDESDDDTEEEVSADA